MSRNYFYIDVCRVDRYGHRKAYRGRDEFATITEARKKLISLLANPKGMQISHYIYYGPGVARWELGTVTRKGNEYVWEQTGGPDGTRGLSYTLYRNGTPKMRLKDPDMMD